MFCAVFFICAVSKVKPIKHCVNLFYYIFCVAQSLSQSVQSENQNNDSSA